ncbi:hypothetical protein AGLY_002672, partial [Aphis glycines]
QLTTVNNPSSTCLRATSGTRAINLPSLSYRISNYNVYTLYRPVARPHFQVGQREQRLGLGDNALRRGYGPFTVVSPVGGIIVDFLVGLLSGSGEVLLQISFLMEVLLHQYKKKYKCPISKGSSVSIATSTIIPTISHFSLCNNHPFSNVTVRNNTAVVITVIEKHIIIPLNTKLHFIWHSIWI